MRDVIKILVDLAYLLTKIIVLLGLGMLIYACFMWFMDVYYWPYLNFYGLKRDAGSLTEPYLKREYSPTELGNFVRRGLVRDHKGWSRAEMAWWWDAVHTVIDMDWEFTPGSIEDIRLQSLRKHRTRIYGTHDANVAARKNILIRKNCIICWNLFFNFLSPLGHLFNYFCDHVFDLHTLTLRFELIELQIKYPSMQYEEFVVIDSYILPFSAITQIGLLTLGLPRPVKRSWRLIYLIWFVGYFLSACAIFFIYLGCLRFNLLNLTKIAFKAGLCDLVKYFIIELYYIYSLTKTIWEVF